MVKKISIFLVFLILLIAFYILIISLLCLQSKIEYYQCSNKVSITANKICKYRFIQGQWPSSLGELVPQYISKEELFTSNGVELEYETHPKVSIDARCRHGHSILLWLSFRFFSPVWGHGVNLDDMYDTLYVKDDSLISSLKIEPNEVEEVNFLSW